jgi:hypothetical protein
MLMKHFAQQIISTNYFNDLFVPMIVCLYTVRTVLLLSLITSKYAVQWMCSIFWRLSKVPFELEHAEEYDIVGIER